MTRISDIKKDLLQFSTEELRDHVRKIRSDSRIQKETAAKRKTRKSKEQKANETVKDLLANMTPAEIAEFLEKLE